MGKILQPEEMIIKYSTLMMNMKPKGSLQAEAKARFERFRQSEAESIGKIHLSEDYRRRMIHNRKKEIN